MPSQAGKPLDNDTAGAPARGKARTAIEVMDFIKDRLRGGNLVPGQRLVEPDLVRETGASRGRVREALLRLSTEGLVELHEFRGASVKRMTRAEVKQSYDMREMLEGLAARLVATSELSKQARTQLCALQRELDAATEIVSKERFIVANAGYHGFIITHASNPFLESFLERLRIPIYRLQFHAFYDADALIRSNKYHQAITAAILAGNGKKAEAAMRAHVRNGYSTVANLADSHFP